MSRSRNTSLPASAAIADSHILRGEHGFAAMESMWMPGATFGRMEAFEQFVALGAGGRGPATYKPRASGL